LKNNQKEERGKQLTKLVIFQKPNYVGFTATTLMAAHEVQKNVLLLTVKMI